jgi:hypothetical protein
VEHVTLRTADIVDAVASHAAACGYFTNVNLHEPKSAPTSGLSAAVWVMSIGPARGQSGLSETSALLVLSVRVYISFKSQPEDAIDPAAMDAVDALMSAYSGDFELDGLVRNVDLLGLCGVPMAALSGYISQDGKTLRVMTITLPLVINDVWEQSE